MILLFQNRTFLAAVAGYLSLSAALAVPEVSNVQMTQRANSRIVDITYELSGEAAIVTLGIETNGVPIPDSSVTRLSGDVCKEVPTGSRSIVWNAGTDWPENLTQLAKARVTAWSTNAPPLYCAVDVAGGKDAESYPVYYYLSADAVPNGVTDDLYKTTSILMRKIVPTGGGGFKMGSPNTEYYRYADREDWHNVVLTKAFYAGVYQVTQSQWYQVMGNWPSKWNNNDYKLTRPVELVSYEDIRGSSAGAGWPANANVDENSFIERLRSKAGLAGIDLPTEAQWEYACRAGTSGALNDGTVNITNATSDARLDALGRYTINSGWAASGMPSSSCTTANATAAVGTYTPNAWGLYDMHGNVYEWCLDWYVESLGTSPAEDPKGAEGGTERVFRNGCYYSMAKDCRSAYRSSYPPSTRAYGNLGFRFVNTLP